MSRKHVGITCQKLKWIYDCHFIGRIQNKELVGRNPINKHEWATPEEPGDKRGPGTTPTCSFLPASREICCKNAVAKTTWQCWFWALTVVTSANCLVVSRENLTVLTPSDSAGSTTVSKWAAKWTIGNYTGI